MKNLLSISILSLALLSLTACHKKGCTNPAASNYESRAIKENGNCKFYTNFKIKRVELQEYDNIVGGDTYDDFDNTNADIYFVLYDISGNVLFVSDETYFDAPGNPSSDYKFDFDLDTTFTNLNEKLIFAFIDYDETNDDFGPLNDDIIHEEIVDFKKYTAVDVKEKFPKKIEIDKSGIEFEIYIDWFE